MLAPARLGLGCALALAAAAQSPTTCSYKSLHADELAFHAQRAVRVDCSAAAPAGAAQSAAVQWSLPGDCSLADPAVQLNSSLVHEIVCAAPGPKTFRVVHLSDDGTASEAMARLSMSRSNLCYDWYITQMSDAGGGEPSAADELAQRGSRVTLRAWIYDHPAASDEEQAGRACHPSTAAQRLTEEFQHLGERPRLLQTTQGAFSVVSVAYDAGRVCWTIVLAVDTTAHRHRFLLDGQHTGILDCHVRPRVAMLTVAPQTASDRPTTPLLAALNGAPTWSAIDCGATHQAATFPAADGADTSILGAQSSEVPYSHTAVAYDRCGEGLAALLQSGQRGSFQLEGVLLSSAVNSAPAVLPLPSDAVGPSSTSCSGVVLLRQSPEDGHAVLVACGHELYRWSNRSWAPESPWPAGQTASQAHARASESCASYISWRDAPPVLAWRAETIAAESAGELPLYIAARAGSQWERVEGLLAFANSQTRNRDANETTPAWQIVDATALEGVPYLSVMLVYSENATAAASGSDLGLEYRLFVLDRARSGWTASAFTHYLGANSTDRECPVHVSGVAAGTAELHVWGSQLWYSPDGGLHAHLVSLGQPETAPAHLCIASVVTSEDNQIAVATESGEMFWGYVGFPHLARIGQKAHSSVVSFDVLGQLLVSGVAHSLGRTQFVRQLVPRDDAFADDGEQPACPYRALSSDLPATVFLDRGESVSATIVVDSDASDACTGDQQAGAPTLAVSSSDFESDRMNVAVDRAGTRNTTALMVSALRYSDSDPGEATAAAFDFATITARVGTDSLLCEPDVVSTMGVNIGCPPGRTIRVIHDADCIPLSEIAGDEQNAEAWTDVDSPYVSVAAEGSVEQDDMCAVRMFHDCAPWRPRVVLYDFDTPKGDVLVDYIMFEKTGRTDYTFNATEAQVGCTRPAQSTELLHAGEVYASCFGTDSEGQDGDGLEQGARRYELLNASGVNALLFTTPGGSGLFTFGVRVVDPSFSHCSLETTFRVHVYGAPIDRATSLMITATTVGVIACSLLLSFACFRTG